MATAVFWRAWSVCIVTVTLSVTALAYTVIHPLPADLADFGVTGLNNAVGILFISAFAAVGALLAWKRPGNPIGWLLATIGLAFAVAAFGVFLAHFPRTLTLANWLGRLYFTEVGLRALG